MALLRLVLNIIWLFVAGFWLAIGYVIAGIICCVLIVTIPFGVASFGWPATPSGPRPGPGAQRGAGGHTALNVIW